MSRGVAVLCPQSVLQRAGPPPFPGQKHDLGGADTDRIPARGAVQPAHRFRALLERRSGLHAGRVVAGRAHRRRGGAPHQTEPAGGRSRHVDSPCGGFHRPSGGGQTAQHGTISVRQRPLLQERLPDGRDSESLRKTDSRELHPLVFPLSDHRPLAHRRERAPAENRGEVRRRGRGVADSQRGRARDAGQDGGGAADGFRPRGRGGDSGAGARGGLQRTARDVGRELQPVPGRIRRPLGARTRHRFHGLRRTLSCRRVAGFRCYGGALREQPDGEPGNRDFRRRIHLVRRGRDFRGVCFGRSAARGERTGIHPLGRRRRTAVPRNRIAALVHRPAAAGGRLCGGAAGRTAGGGRRAARARTHPL